MMILTLCLIADELDGSVWNRPCPMVIIAFLFHGFFCIYVMVMMFVSRLSLPVDLHCFYGILYMDYFLVMLLNLDLPFCPCCVNI